MLKSITIWDEILTLMGGTLELSKCCFYIIDWEFNSDERPIIKIIRLIS